VDRTPYIDYLLCIHTTPPPFCTIAILKIYGHSESQRTDFAAVEVLRAQGSAYKRTLQWRYSTLYSWVTIHVHISHTRPRIRLNRPVPYQQLTGVVTHFSTRITVQCALHMFVATCYVGHCRHSLLSTPPPWCAKIAILKIIDPPLPPPWIWNSIYVPELLQGLCILSIYVEKTPPYPPPEFGILSIYLEHPWLQGCSMGGGRGGVLRGTCFLSIYVTQGWPFFYLYSPPLPWGPLHSIYLCRKNLPPTPPWIWDSIYVPTGFSR